MSIEGHALRYRSNTTRQVLAMSGDFLERAAREWYAAKYKVSIYDQDDWYAAHAADFARDRLDAQRKKVANLFTKLQVAESFIESAREHFEDPETTRCADCTNALVAYDTLSAKPIEEIRAELKKGQQ